ncbi:MAG: hypothetical protein JNL21_04390 [Myxococcales bacterium]|nr:hypothetical protein [Myxococcales bacterium]
MKRYMVVIELPESVSDGRQTGRFDKVNAVTLEAQNRLRAWLNEQGAARDSFSFDPPMAFGTFGGQCTEDVARLIRRAPGVQAVMEIG